MFLQLDVLVASIWQRLSNVLHIGHVLFQLRQVERVFGDEHFLLSGSDFQSRQLFVQIHVEDLVFQSVQRLAQLVEIARIDDADLSQQLQQPFQVEQNVFRFV